MKVKAIEPGYYGLRRIKEGEVFEIVKEKDFSKTWMVKVGSDEVSESEQQESQSGDESGSEPKPKTKKGGKGKGKGKKPEKDVI